MDVEVTVRVKTQQVIIPGQEHKPNELPLRRWTVEMYMLNDNQQEETLDIITHCLYKLHPTFRNPRQVKTVPPYLIDEIGWGQFDLEIECKLFDGLGSFHINHSILFKDNAYSIDYVIKVPLEVNEQADLALSRHIQLPATRNATQIKELQTLMGKIDQLREQDLTKLVQLVINDDSIKAILPGPRLIKETYLDMTKLPMELQDKIIVFMNEALRSQ